MTEEKWEQLVEIAKRNFKNVELATEDLMVQTQDGEVKQGTQDILIFEKPAGPDASNFAKASSDKSAGASKFKVVRENRPTVLEKKMHYSHRGGDTARAEYKYSDTQFSHKVRVFKEVGFDDWEEITLDKIGL